MKKVIITIFIILFILLVMILFTISNLQSQEAEEFETDIESVDVSTVTEEGKTIKQIIEESDAKYLEENGETIYVEFSKDLFDEEGESNKDYFFNIIKKLQNASPEKSFILLDQAKNIDINVKYSTTDKEYIIKIKDIENFYDVIDGKKYVGVDKISIVPTSNFLINNSYLSNLSINKSYFKTIKDYLGEGEPLEDNYTSYLDGKIKIRLSPVKTVRNIIFTEKCEGDITKDIKLGMSLREIQEINNTNAFGSLEENYLGYREGDFYLFFYNNETSVYSYAYEYNEEFEDLLDEYLASKNLDNFINSLLQSWKTYDYYEYDAEKQSAYILYSTRGVEIDIKNNDSKGIKLYTNYYFTNKTKDYVKRGLIDVDLHTDLVDKVEKERRASEK